jgi:hypothetical protein
VKIIENNSIVWNQKIKCNHKWCNSILEITPRDIRFHDSLCHNCCYSFVTCPVCGREIILSEELEHSIYEFMKINKLFREDLKYF